MANANPIKTPAKKASLPIDLYAVQCEECFSWRLINSKEEFEDIRSKLIEEPFVCHRKANTLCGDPTDIEYDATRTWVIDKPNIPKTPKGFERILLLRSNLSKLDAYYFTPTGKKVRCVTELASFLDANPKYKDIPLSSFTFSVPKVMEDTIPESILKESFNGGTSSSNKRIKKVSD